MSTRVLVLKKGWALLPSFPENKSIFTEEISCPLIDPGLKRWRKQDELTLRTVGSGGRKLEAAVIGLLQWGFGLDVPVSFQAPRLTPDWLQSLSPKLHSYSFSPRIKFYKLQSYLSPSVSKINFLLPLRVIVFEKDVEIKDASGYNFGTHGRKKEKKVERRLIFFRSNLIKNNLLLLFQWKSVKGIRIKPFSIIVKEDNTRRFINF